MRSCIMKAILALACTVVLASTAGAGKFSPALKMDTYTDASRADESFGSEGTLGVTSENGQTMRMAYLTFEGMIKLPQQISSASMKIYVKEVERPGKVSLYLYDQAAMDIITWADQPEHDPEAVGTLDIQGPGWQTWDATAFVKKAAAECSEGCPFSVVLVADDNASIEFASLESSPEEKPALEYEAS